MQNKRWRTLPIVICSFVSTVCCSSTSYALIEFPLEHRKALNCHWTKNQYQYQQQTILWMSIDRHRHRTELHVYVCALPSFLLNRNHSFHFKFRLISMGREATLFSLSCFLYCYTSSPLNNEHDYTGCALLIHYAGFENFVFKIAAR